MDEAGFIREVSARLDVDEETAQAITSAVLHVLRSRLTANQVAHLDAQLPTRLKRFRTRSGLPTRAIRLRKQEFFRRVGLLTCLPGEQVPHVTQAVFKVLQEALQSPTGHEGGAWGVFSQLPMDLKRIWSEASRMSDGFKEVAMKVEQVMSREVVVCTEHDSLNRAAELMWENDCGCLPVLAVNGTGTLAGMITDRDIAMAAYFQGKRLAAMPVSEVMSKAVAVCRVGDEVKQVEALMRDHQVRRLPVLDARQKLVGVVSLNDLARRAADTREQRAIGGVVETISAVSRPRHLRTMPITNV